MRQNSQISALLRQVRAGQKAVFAQLSLELGNSVSWDLTRHLILILFVLRILARQTPGLVADSNAGKRSRIRLRTEPLAQLLQADSRSGNLESNRIYSRLVEQWRSIQPYFAGLPVSLDLLPDLPLPDRLLRSLIRRLDAGKEPQADALFCSSLLGQVYETLLIQPAPAVPNNAPGSRRKAQGIYYTPVAIVQFMAQQTIDRLLASATGWDGGSANDLPRLLDPACGGGAFLLEAYQRLLDWQLRRLVIRGPAGKDGLIQGESGEWQLSWEMRQQILQRCIYGVDLDPEAVTITQLSLWLKLLEETFAPHDPLPDCLPDLNANVQIGNTLLVENEILPQAADMAKADRETRASNWEKTVPAILQAGGFDGVMGNPPYLDSEQMTLSCPTWRTYCAARYQTAIGNWDLFCVFIERALMLCRSGGVASLIVPNKLASAPYAAQARSLLIGHRLLLIRDYAQVPVFAASVYPLVYVVQKTSAANSPTETLNETLNESANPGINQFNPFPHQNQVRYEVMADLTTVQRSGWLNQNSDRPEADWQLAQSAVHVQAMQRLQQLPTLGSIAQVFGAATVGEAYALQPWLQECEIPGSGDFRFVNSGTIDRYLSRWGKKPTRYLGQIYQHPILSGDRLHHLPARRQQQARQPKIIVAGLSQQLECVLDPAGNLLPGKSTCIILGIPDAIDWRYLLALLNSRLLTAYWRSSASGNQLQSGYVRVGTAQLKQLPIYLPDFSQSRDRRIYTEIVELAQLSLAERSQDSLNPTANPTANPIPNGSSEVDPQIEERVAHLYQLTDEEAALIAHTHSSKDSKRLPCNGGIG